MTKWLLILCNVLWIGKWSLIEFTQNQSCSRVHAALVHHKHLNRAFLVDLGSTHGTYIGSVRLEGHKPTPLPMDRYAYTLQTPTYSHNHLLMLFTATSSTITLLKLYIRKRFHDFSVFHFGASTRNYVIRERPQTGARPVMEEIEKTSMTAEGDKGAALLGKCLIKMMRNILLGTLSVYLVVKYSGGI